MLTFDKYTPLHRAAVVIKNYLLYFVLCGIGVAVLVFSMFRALYAQPLQTTAGAATAPAFPADTISISMVGDMMVGSSYPNDTMLPPYSHGSILKYALPYLKKTDLRIGNLESAISDTAHMFKDCTGANCYAFRTPYKYALWYKEAGFEYLNLANNHSFDFGIEGVRHTMHFLDSCGIRYSGIYQHHFDTLTIHKMTIGFLSFAPHTNCLDLNNDSLVTAMVTEANKKCRLLIIFFHGGAEGASRQHVPYEHEMFLEQDRGDLRHFTHLCIDAGADLVVGSGPHVVRGMEIYKYKLISYSLGNFSTYHQFNLKFPNNIAPLQQIRITDKGIIVKNEILSFIQIGEGVPVTDTANNAFKLIERLSFEDFGATGIVTAGPAKHK